MNDETKAAVSEAVDVVAEVADEAVNDPWFKRLARFGFYTKGVLYIVIGGLAVAAVAGIRGAHLADPRGAIAVIAGRPYGRVLLVVFIVGAIGHGLWNILRSVTDVDERGRRWFGVVIRSFQALIAFFYFGMAISAIEMLLASTITGESSQAEETFVAVILAVPLFGAGVIGLIGLGLVGAGISECYNGVSGRFQANYRKWEITGFHGAFITFLGILSFSVRAVLLIILGYFFLQASFFNEQGGPIGIDATLLALLATSYGRILVLIAGAGLIGHGVLAFYEARYRRIC